MTTIHAITASQFLENPEYRNCELICGEVAPMTPASAGHGRIAARMVLRLAGHVETNRLGTVYTSETGFQIARNPDTVRAPDVAYVRKSRAQSDEAAFFNGPPDLAVEVVSPNDRLREVMNKVQQWLSAGCSQVWVIDPGNRSVTVYHPDGQAKVLRANDRLAGGDLLPGFEISVEDIFAE
jgi:Uma2 family endonuclease